MDELDRAIRLTENNEINRTNFQLSSKLFYCEPNEQNEDVEEVIEGNAERTICRKIDTLYLCSTTRPRNMVHTSSIRGQSQSIHDTEFPILPFSDRSKEIYKKLKALWNTQLSDDEELELFGKRRASDDLMTLECPKCRPNIEKIRKIHASYGENKTLGELENLLNRTESNLSEENHLEPIEEIVESVTTTSAPRDVLQEIIDQLNEQVKERLQCDESIWETAKKIEGKTVTNEADENTSFLVENDTERFDIQSDLDSDNLEGSAASKSGDRDESSIYLPPDGVFIGEDSSKSSKTSTDPMQRFYLKPEEQSDVNGKERYENEQPTKLVNLLEKLDSNDLKELKGYFFPKNVNYEKTLMENDVKNVENYAGIPFNKIDFMEAIDNIIGAKEYTLAAGQLFDRMKAEGRLKEDLLWWEQLLDEIIDFGKQSDRITPKLRLEEVSTNFTPFSKSPIINILTIRSDKMITYVALARLGQVGVFNGRLLMQHCYNVPINHYKSRKCCWLTDACYSIETETLFITASSRSLYLYNTSRVVHKLIQIVSGMKEIPECIHYSHLAANSSIIMIGDKEGSIITFDFKQTSKSFFQFAPDRESNPTYYWQDVMNQKEWVEITVEKKLHNDIVLQIEYMPRTECIISASLDVRRSMVIRQRWSHGRTPYVFSIEKGVKCFRLDQELGILATISGDTMVRVWDPVNTTRPLGFLQGHRAATVLDVALVANRRLAISMDTLKELRLWDTEIYSCLQTMMLTFPEIICTRHLLIKFPSIYIDNQTASDMDNSNTSNMITKPVLIVNINNIKLLEMHMDVDDEDDEVTSVDMKLPVDERPSLEKKYNEEQENNFQTVVGDFQSKTFNFSDRGVNGESLLGQYVNLKQNEDLLDFVKDGTPYLGLHLQQIDDTMLHHL